MINKILNITSVLILVIASSFIFQKETRNYLNNDKTIFYSGNLGIGADLNGDKEIEEVFIDVISGNNNKHLDSITYNGNYNDYLVQFKKIKPRIIIKSDHKIPQIIVNDDPRILQPISFSNLGDLNDDGNDEIGYVLEWFETEKTDSMHIISYRNKKWIKLGAVPISITYTERFYSVNTSDLITKNNNKLFYKDKNNEEIEFKLKK